jgi:hypothetical protein
MLIGVLVLAPLTLWRLPTFILVYRIHNSRKLFFPILLTIYKLMAVDILVLAPNILACLWSPICYVKFRLKMSFKYGIVGYTELMNIKLKK